MKASGRLKNCFKTSLGFYSIIWYNNIRGKYYCRGSVRSRRQAGRNRVMVRMDTMDKFAAKGAAGIKTLINAFLQRGLEQKLIIICVASIFLTAYAAGVVCGVTALIFLLRKRTRDAFIHSPGFLYACIFCGVGVIGSLLTQNWLGLLGTVFVMFPMLVVYITAAYFMDKSLIQICFRILCILSIAVVFIGIIQLLIKGTNYRPEATFHNPNLLANALSLVLITAVAAFVAVYDKKYSVLYAAAVTFCVAGVLFTQCRTAIPSIAAAGLIVLLVMKKYKLAVIYSGGCAAVLLVALFNIEHIPRLLNVEENWHERMDIITVALEGFLERPIFGGGPFYFRIYGEGLMSRNYLHAHNLFVNFLLDFGVAGTGSMLIMFGEQLKDVFVSFKKRKRACVEISAVAGCLIYTIAHGMLDVTAFNVQTGQLLLFIIAAGIAAVHFESPSRNNKKSETVYLTEKEK